MYKSYIFDLYGTLIDIHTDEEKEYLWDRMAYVYDGAGAMYTKDELREQYLKFCALETEKVAAQKRAEYVDIKIEKVFRRLFEFKNVNADDRMVIAAARTFRCISETYIKAYDGVTDMLDRLKEAGRGVYLLTNAQRVFTEPELNITGLADYFDGIVISSDEEISKPSPEIFDILLKRYKLNKKECIMIGNDYNTDIKGGADFGLDTLYIRSNQSTDYKEHAAATYEVNDGDITKILEKIF